MDRQILLALQKAMKYIELHEDTGAFSKQTDGKMLYAELWMLSAQISHGDKSTYEAPPLSGTWRYNQGYLCCGTLRIARDDFDTGHSEEFKSILMGWVCKTLNDAQDAAFSRTLMQSFNQALLSSSPGGSVEAASEPRMSLHEAEQYADAFEGAVLDYHVRNKRGALENLVKVQKKLIDALRLSSSPVGTGGGA